MIESPVISFIGWEGGGGGKGWGKKGGNEDYKSQI